MVDSSINTGQKTKSNVQDEIAESLQFKKDLA